MLKTQAQRFSEMYYATPADVQMAGAIWDALGGVWVFPDHSIGSFTDIRNGAAERTATGKPILHFVNGGIHPDYLPD